MPKSIVIEWWQDFSGEVCFGFKIVFELLNQGALEIQLIVLYEFLYCWIYLYFEIIMCNFKAPKN